MNIENNKIELVTVGSLFQDLGWENPAEANDVEWIELGAVGQTTHYYAWNDYDTAVRNTPEIRERVVGFWAARLQWEIDFPINGNYTQENKDRCVAWTRLMLESIDRQVARGQSWILISISPEECIAAAVSDLESKDVNRLAPTNEEMEDFYAEDLKSV